MTAACAQYERPRIQDELKRFFRFQNPSNQFVNLGVVSAWVFKKPDPSEHQLATALHATLELVQSGYLEEQRKGHRRSYRLLDPANLEKYKKPRGANKKLMLERLYDLRLGAPLAQFENQSEADYKEEHLQKECHCYEPIESDYSF